MLIWLMIFSAYPSLAETAHIADMQSEYAQMLAGQWQASDGSGEITIEAQNIYISADGEAFLLQDGKTLLKILLSADANAFGLINESENTSVFYTRSGETAPEGVIAPVTAASSASDGYSFQQIFEMCVESVVFLQLPGGSGGTGFYIDEHILLTNDHVISGADWINAVTSDGGTYPVSRVLGFNNNPDLALLYIDRPGKPLPMNTHGVSTGEEICIIGAPMGIYPSISNGIVLNSSYEDGGVNFILSNAHIIGGNSGGPAFNRFGEVIGVAVGGMSDGPNAIDLIIHIDHIKDIDMNATKELSKKEEFYVDMNVADEEKYETVSLQEAQPGTLVTLGHYEQDCNMSNGAEEILWQVMERNGDELTLMSLYCLDAAPYNVEYADVTWETSTIRAYLNNDFYSAVFSAEEQEMILTTTVVNSDNPVYGTPGGNDTQDKVYLLSLAEVQKYWNIDGNIETVYDQLYAQATDYCVAQGVRLEIEGVSRPWWWLRSIGGASTQACEVGSDGYFSFNGGAVSDTDHAIRPVIHVKVP